MAVTPEMLREIELFQSLPKDVLQKVATHCQMMELPAGDTLFEQDAPGEAFYLLHDGQVHIVRTMPNGEEVVLATHGPYYVIGELSMIVGQPRTGAVVAVSDCTLVKLERESFLAILNQHPSIATDVLMNVGMRLYQMNLQVREHAIGNVPARAASLLLLLTGDQPDKEVVGARVTRMARAVGVDADSLDRLLTSWVDQGLIYYDGRRLRIRQIESIRDLAG